MEQTDPETDITKLRGCQNAARAGVNTFCEVRTPVSLYTVDDVVELVANFVEKLPSNKKNDVGLIKKDQKNAYKNFGIRKEHRRFAVSVAKDPSSGRLKAFVSHVEYFGAESAVLNYNVVAKVVHAISRRILGIPAVGFYDDFIFPCRNSLVDSVRRGFSKFFTDIINLEFRSEKDEFGRKVKYTGQIIFQERIKVMWISYGKRVKATWIFIHI